MFDKIRGDFFGHAFAHSDIDEAGRNGINGNVLTRKLARGDFGERDDRGFARRIICLAKKPHLATDRREVHDSSAAVQNRGGLLRDCECADEIHAHHALEFFRRHFFDRAVVDNPGIVHENIEAASLVADLGHHRFDLARLRHVALDHKRRL